MQIIGPFINCQVNTPKEWAYFAIDQEKNINYYIAPIENSNKAEWVHTILQPMTPIYAYDFQTKSSICYIINNNQLLKVPLIRLGNEDIISLIEKLSIINSQTYWIPHHQRIKEFNKIHNINLNISNYPNINPALIWNPPIIHQLDDLVIPQQPHNIHLSLGNIKDALQISEYFLIDNEQQIPQNSPNQTMYIWKKEQTYYFQVRILNEIKTGIFDPILDEFVISVLENNHHSSKHILIHMSRPYLMLTATQQSIITATLNTDWPLNDEISSPEMIQICHLLLQRKHIVLETKNSNNSLAAALEIFILYMTPYRINQLFRSKMFSNRMANSNDTPTINDVITFIDTLVIASLKLLGDNSPVSYYPSTNQTNWGEFHSHENIYQLINAGLSTKDENLFQIFLTYASESLNNHSIQDLITLRTAIYDLIATNTNPQIMDAANEILAAICARQQLNNEQAKILMQQQCQRMLNDIENLIITKIPNLTTTELADIISNIYTYSITPMIVNKMFQRVLINHPEILPTYLQSFSQLGKNYIDEIISTKMPENNTILMYAIKNQCTSEVIQILLKFIINNLENKNTIDYIKHKNNYHHNVLMLAAKYQPKTIKILLQLIKDTAAEQILPILLENGPNGENFLMIGIRRRDSISGFENPVYSFFANIINQDTITEDLNDLLSNLPDIIHTEELIKFLSATNIHGANILMLSIKELPKISPELLKLIKKINNSTILTSTNEDGNNALMIAARYEPTLVPSIISAIEENYIDKLETTLIQENADEKTALTLIKQYHPKSTDVIEMLQSYTTKYCNSHKDTQNNACK